MKKLSNIKLNFNKSILIAMKLIDRNSKGLCFVVDNSNKLLGVLTDGDIRRAII